MTRATNSGHPGAGAYGTSRKEALTHYDIRQASIAIGARATPAMIARYLGRCETDVRALLDGAIPHNDDCAEERYERFRPWTPDEIRLFDLMHEEGKATAAQIAAALNRTERAITARIQRKSMARAA